MRRLNTAAAAVSFAAVAGFALPAHAQVTAYEGARVIVGNGTVIENGTIVVDGARIVSAGDLKAAKVPANAKRVDLKGKTVMPMIIDSAHTSSRQAIGTQTFASSSSAPTGV